MDDIEDWLSNDDDPVDGRCHGCGFVDCECDLDPDDCLNCGVCESCIERSVAAADERPVFENCNVCGIRLRDSDEYQMGMCVRCATETVDAIDLIKPEETTRADQ